MSAKLKIQLKKVWTITLIWMVLGVIFTFTDHFLLLADISAGPKPDYILGVALAFNIGAAFMGALMGGTFLVFFVNEKFRDRSYGFSIMAVAVGYIVIVSIVTLVLGIVSVPLEVGKPLSDPETRAALKEFYLNPLHLKNLIMWSLVVMVTQLILQMNDKFGQGLLWDFIWGKYHQPRTESRIFMFVDLKSSTTIAENLGNEKYYLLLRDFFADITNPILFNKGEIYQYVGDEIVISWKMENGLENNHCLQCYFDMQKKIADHKERYQQRYGLVPEFKAGMHYGEVTAGEIGIIKRDLTFSGDVLNTAARIQGTCNQYEVGLLSSDKLLDLLSLGSFQKRNIGAISLKGKAEKVALSTVEMA